MDRLTRWETEALRRRSGRPRPRSKTIDLRDTSAHDRHHAVESESPPAGTLLVPLDAWQRMLDQLGNLHEAGQQLAEMSARAARAETEAEFLRERVSDLRRQLADAATDEIPADEPASGETPATPEASAEVAEDESRSDQRGSDQDSRLAVAGRRARSVYTDLRKLRRHRSR